MMNNRKFTAGHLFLVILLAITAACNFITITLPSQPDEPASTETAPVLNAMDQIIAAINSRNYQALEGFMEETVLVRLESSGCCGPIPKSEATSQLSYLDQAAGWDFDPANPIIAKLAAAFPEYYGDDWLVGVADNEYVASFKLNDQMKIEAYNLAVTFKLLLP